MCMKQIYPMKLNDIEHLIYFITCYLLAHYPDCRSFTLQGTRSQRNVRIKIKMVEYAPSVKILI